MSIKEKEKEKEIILETIENLWSDKYIDTISEPKAIKDMTPWLSIDKIDSKISIRWGWWEVGTKVKSLSFTRSSLIWIWTQDFTWFWFNPTSYKILCWRDSTGESVLYSDCLTSENWSELWYRVQTISGEVLSYTTGYALYIRATGSVRTRAAHDAFIDDWIRLDFRDSYIDISMIITAYW